MWVKFHLGQNEDCSLGDSNSDSSEKRLQRGRGEGQYIRDFGEGSPYFLQKVSASHEEQSSPWRILVFFWKWGDTTSELGSQNWLLKISNYLKTCSASFSQSRVPHFCSPPWKSAAAAAYDLILVEVDGKCPWRVPICSWQCLRAPYELGKLTLHVRISKNFFLGCHFSLTLLIVSIFPKKNPKTKLKFFHKLNWSIFSFIASGLPHIQVVKEFTHFFPPLPIRFQFKKFRCLVQMEFVLA